METIFILSLSQRLKWLSFNVFVKDSFFLFNLIVIVDTITNVPSIPPHPPSTKPLLRRPTAMSHAFVQIRPLACLFQSPHPPHSFFI